jgi:hypothetical protein
MTLTAEISVFGFLQKGIYGQGEIAFPEEANI